MSEKQEREGSAFPVYTTKNGWHYEGRGINDRIIIDAILKAQGSEDIEDIREHAEYRLFETDEIPASIYVTINEESTPGSLPHGHACYIAAWDIILIQPEEIVFVEGRLSLRTFTTLAHEVGHRLAHKRGLAKSDYDEAFDKDQEELLAWQLAIQAFGSRSNFDHVHARSYMETHQKSLEEKRKASA